MSQAVKIRESNWLELRSDGGFLGKLQPNHWLFAATMVVILCIGSIISIALVDRDSERGQSQQALVVDQPVGSTADDVAKCLGGAAMANEGCILRDTDNTLQPTVDVFADDTRGAYGCYRTKGQEVKSCTYGYQQIDAKRIAIIGDSHAAMLLPALSPYLSKNKWSLTTYVGFGCQWQLSIASDCGEAMKEIQADVISKDYDAVITTSTRKFGGTSDNVAAAAYSSTWSAVTASGTKVIAVADNPAVTEESMQCLTRVSLGTDRTGDCGASRVDALKPEDPLIASVRSVAGASLIDLTSYYCTADWCPTVIGDDIVYRDTAGHLTGAFSQTLSPYLISEISAIVG